jgi:hypothetical protein
VFDLKYGGIFAGTAFFLSLVIGIVSRSTMPMLVVRPLIFAVLFFAITAFGKILVSRYLPELMEGSAPDDDDFKPGSRINILEDDGPSDSSAVTEGFVSGALGQVPTGAKPDDSEDDLGDISELSKRSAYNPVNERPIPGISGIDQNVKEQYTDNGEMSDSVKPDFSKIFSPESPLKASATSQAKAGAKTEGIHNSDEALPDWDSMAGAFMSGSSNDEPEANEYIAPGSFKKSSSAKKAPEWTEDFNAKEIAMGLRTVLNKDKEG